MNSEREQIEMDAETLALCRLLGVTVMGQQIALMRFIDEQIDKAIAAERERVARAIETVAARYGTDFQNSTARVFNEGSQDALNALKAELSPKEDESK